MFATHTQNDQIITGNDIHSGLRVAGSKFILMPFNSADPDISNVSATIVLGYLLALVSAAVLLLTGQPPWFLLTVAVAMAVALFLPGGLNVIRPEQIRKDY